MAGQLRVSPGIGLVIGIDDYAQKPLRFCVRDAGRMHEKLHELGWPDNAVAFERDLNSDGLHGRVASFVEELQQMFNNSNAAAFTAVVAFFILLDMPLRRTSSSG
mmetsp:Transcript_68519/g.194124  ORF Transcript_68519/g.194124 Transcript_68519/m.194124 type:complete len:105 (+) Transcript_68519:91-405(+)